ncbi:MAG: DsbA family protein, partial [Burkholderiales bacterium]|nr:DsbA family protein [Burkholderiales bacterium]
DALALLASDDGVPEIREAEDTARRIGVQGVPFFIFDQQVALSGAQPAEALVEAMEQARVRAARESAA